MQMFSIKLSLILLTNNKYPWLLEREQRASLHQNGFTYFMHA